MRALLQLFDRPRPKVTLALSSPAQSTPMGGLVILEIRLPADTAVQGQLRVFVGDAGRPAFQAPLGPGQPPPSWLALHGHLLPDGPVAVRVEVRDPRGRRLAEASLTVQVRNEGALAAQVADSLRRTGVPLVVAACDSGLYDYGDPALTAWFDRSDAEVAAHLDALAGAGAATADEIEALRHFAENGYLAIPDALAPEHLARLNAALDDAVDKKLEGYEWGSSQRIHNLHHDYPAVRELWLHPTVIRLLGLIFEAPPLPCQSLTYVFGSEQQYHQDTIHLTSFPAGRMCGVWAALEDVQPDSGELVVFPTSHRLPRVYMRTAGAAKVTGDWSEFADKVVPLWTDFITANRLRREVYQPKAGAILIWHENLMHAGSPRRDRTKSRRSIVGHYFARGAVVWYDSSGLPGVLYEGDLAP